MIIDNELIFQDEDVVLFQGEADVPQNAEYGKWKVMIVDDDKDVHNVTKLVLKDFYFDGKTLEFISAYSGAEARKLIESTDDIAVMLIDVVMEEDDTGLKLVKWIREELKNKLVRIILRTGQPGRAPEKSVIVNYDINDYKEKTELTAQKLFTTMVASLRSYRDVRAIELSKRGLEKIIESSATIFEVQSMKKFANGVLTQLTSILNLNKSALYCQTSSFAATRNDGEFFIMAGTGDYEEDLDRNIREIVPENIMEKLDLALQRKRSIYFDNYVVAYFKSENGSENLIYMEGFNSLDELDKYLIEIFCSNVSIAFDNIYLNKEIENTQKEIVFTLGEAAEARSKETSNHVKRVAEYTKLLALKYGLPEEEAEILRLASPIHDVGKLAIPDNILNKPAKLTPEEFEIIKTHSNIGYEILKKSSRQIIKSAAIIALQHHEKYDGSGYPLGLKGDEIHVYGRITAVADVFDALGSDRVYKKAWEMDRILELFKQEKGKHFDPVLVDILFNNLKEFIEIKDKFADL